MGRIRTVKPEFFFDEELSALSCETHLLAAALLCYADDFGYFNANPGLIRANTLTLRELSGDIPEMIENLSRMGYLRLGTAADGKRYGHIVKFSVHQRVSHPTASKISSLPITWEDSGEFPEVSRILRNISALNREQGTGNREHISSDGEPSGDTSPLQKEKNEAVSRGFAYYLDKTGRDPVLYAFTPDRKKKGITRLDECLKKTNGDLESAVELMKAAIDALAASDWHMGRDPKTQGKCYREWDSHLFGSYKTMERWWNQ
jgi:hypothetical protein